MKGGRVWSLWPLAMVARDNLKVERLAIFAISGGLLTPLVAVAQERMPHLWQRFQALPPAPLPPELKAALAAQRPVYVPEPATDPRIPAGWAEQLQLGPVVLVPVGQPGDQWALLASDAPRTTRAMHTLSHMSAAVSALLHCPFHRPVPWTPPVAGGPLSRREIEVLALVADGCSNKEIARRLFLSTDTVKFHLRQVFLSLHAADRQHAVEIARAKGLLAPCACETSGSAD